MLKNIFLLLICIFFISGCVAKEKVPEVALSEQAVKYYENLEYRNCDEQENREKAFLCIDNLSKQWAKALSEPLLCGQIQDKDIFQECMNLFQTQKGLLYVEDSDCMDREDKDLCLSYSDENSIKKTAVADNNASSCTESITNKINQLSCLFNVYLKQAVENKDASVCSTFWEDAYGIAVAMDVYREAGEHLAVRYFSLCEQEAGIPSE